MSSILVGCGAAASIRKMKTTAGDYTLIFSGEEQRDVDMKADGTGYTIYDGENKDNVIIDATYLDTNVYKVPTAFSEEIVNGVKYIKYSDNANTYYVTHLGQFGADIGIMFTTDIGKESEMQYIKLKGKPIEGCKISIYDYIDTNGYTADNSTETSLNENSDSNDINDTSVTNDTKDNSVINDNNTIVDNNKVICFTDGDSFSSPIELTEIDLYNTSEEDGTTDLAALAGKCKVYITPDENTMLYTYKLSSTEYTPSTFVNAIADKIKAETGEDAPVTINQEGYYLNGMSDNRLDLVFATEGIKDETVALELITVDADNSTNTMNSIIDCLLSSGITKATSRYDSDSNMSQDNSSPTSNSTTNDSTTNSSTTSNSTVQNRKQPPTSYEITYECEYFTTYNNGSYEVEIYDNPISVEDYYAEARDTGKCAIWDGIYEITDKFDVSVNGYNFTVIEKRSLDSDIGDMYSYSLISNNSIYCVDIEENELNKIDSNTIESLLKDFF